MKRRGLVVARCSARVWGQGHCDFAVDPGGPEACDKTSWREVDGAQHLSDAVAYRRDRRKDQLLHESRHVALFFTTASMLCLRAGIPENSASNPW